MQNPSYLIKSRHDIFYFRYPLPFQAQGKLHRVSISLKTRCPRQALIIAKELEYHTIKILEKLRHISMNYKDLTDLLKTHYTNLLEAKTAEMDNHGALTTNEVKYLQHGINLLDQAIEKDVDGIDDIVPPSKQSQSDKQEAIDDILANHGLNLSHLLNTERTMPTIDETMQEIIKANSLDYQQGSSEYALLRSADKFARKKYYEGIITHNERLRNIDLSGDKKHYSQENKPHTYTLQTIIDGFVNELEKTNKPDNVKAKKTYLNYLVECLGSDFIISHIDGLKVQEIKENLQQTPTNRNVIELTRGLSLFEQIEITKQHNLKQWVSVILTNTYNVIARYFIGLKGMVLFLKTGLRMLKSRIRILKIHVTILIKMKSEPSLMQ